VIGVIATDSPQQVAKMSSESSGSSARIEALSHTRTQPSGAAENATIAFSRAFRVRIRGRGHEGDHGDKAPRPEQRDDTRRAAQARGARQGAHGLLAGGARSAYRQNAHIATRDTPMMRGMNPGRAPGRGQVAHSRTRCTYKRRPGNGSPKESRASRPHPEPGYMMAPDFIRIRRTCHASFAGRAEVHAIEEFSVSNCLSMYLPFRRLDDLLDRGDPPVLRFLRHAWGTHPRA